MWKGCKPDCGEMHAAVTHVSAAVRAHCLITLPPSTPDVFRASLLTIFIFEVAPALFVPSDARSPIPSTSETTAAAMLAVLASSGTAKTLLCACASSRAALPPLQRRQPPWAAAGAALRHAAGRAVRTSSIAQAKVKPSSNQVGFVLCFRLGVSLCALAALGHSSVSALNPSAT